MFLSFLSVRQKRKGASNGPWSAEKHHKGERQSSRKKKLTAVAQAAVDSGSIDMPYMRVGAFRLFVVDFDKWKESLPRKYNNHY